MKVKDIIKNALVLIGREDVLRSMKLIEADEELKEDTDGENEELKEDTDGVTVEKHELTPEEKETVETLLYCFNSVEDELARCYFPLVKSERLSSEDGVYPFSDFSERPLKIISVKAGGREIKYEADFHNLKTGAAEITVAYRYAPAKKALDGNSEFCGERVSERLVASGTASEYFLICGEVTMAQSWESVYRGEIDRLQRKSISEIKFPPRRWV